MARKMRCASDRVMPLLVTEWDNDVMMAKDKIQQCFKRVFITSGT
jgi:hypothetical protein